MYEKYLTIPVLRLHYIWAHLSRSNCSDSRDTAATDQIEVQPAELFHSPLYGSCKRDHGVLECCAIDTTTLLDPAQA
jgi:hypothetical protein